MRTLGYLFNVYRIENKHKKRRISGERVILFSSEFSGIGGMHAKINT